MIYRLYTEDLRRKEVVSIITKYYQGFTIYETDGYWKLKREPSIVIEIVTNENFININQICDEIRKLNDQESVLVVKIHAESSFI